MAYLELSKEAYNDIIMAAGIKGSKVAAVCRDKGVWEAAAAEEAPPNVSTPPGVPDLGHPFQPVKPND